MAALPLKLLALGFVAGALATVLFHQGAWYLLVEAGVIPPDRPAWPLDPIAPFGVPSVISKAIWGGLWGAGLALLLGHLSGASYWGSWIVVGALALTLVAFFVVPPLKGEAMPALWPRSIVGLLVNGAWGLGTGIFLWLFGAARP